MGQTVLSFDQNLLERLENTTQIEKKNILKTIWDKLMKLYKNFIWTIWVKPYCPYFPLIRICWKHCKIQHRSNYM